MAAGTFRFCKHVTYTYLNNFQKETLFKVSDPYSLSYGKYPSSSQVQEQTGPRPRAISQIIEWLASVHVNPTKDEIQTAEKTGYMPITLKINQAEKLLQCSFQFYKNIKNNRIIVRSLQYSIPVHLKQIIAFVGGGK